MGAGEDEISPIVWLGHCRLWQKSMSLELASGEADGPKGGYFLPLKLKVKGEGDREEKLGSRENSRIL